MSKKYLFLLAFLSSSADMLSTMTAYLKIGNLESNFILHNLLAQYGVIACILWLPVETIFIFGLSYFPIYWSKKFGKYFKIDMSELSFAFPLFACGVAVWNLILAQSFL